MPAIQPPRLVRTPRTDSRQAPAAPRSRRRAGPSGRPCRRRRRRSGRHRSQRSGRWRGRPILVNRSAPPTGLSFRYRAAGPLPPAMYRSGRPSPSQSRTATPPPTEYGKSPAYVWSTPAEAVSFDEPWRSEGDRRCRMLRADGQATAEDDDRANDDERNDDRDPDPSHRRITGPARRSGAVPASRRRRSKLRRGSAAPRRECRRSARSESSEDDPDRTSSCSLVLQCHSVGARYPRTCFEARRVRRWESFDRGRLDCPDGRYRPNSQLASRPFVPPEIDMTDR